MELVATRHEQKRLEQHSLYLPPTEVDKTAPNQLSPKGNQEVELRSDNDEAQLEQLYQKALVALEKRQQAKAKKLLLTVIALQPNYYVL